MPCRNVIHLKETNPVAALKVAASIRAASKRLEAHPFGGREQSNGSYKLVEVTYGYLIYYGVDVEKQIVSLYSIHHGAQKRPTDDT